MQGGKYKGTAVFVIGIVLTLVVVAVLLYLLFSKFGQSASFKSGFGDMSGMDPLTRFYMKNRQMKEMYASQLSVDSGTTYDVYKEFVDNPGDRTPKHIYEKAVEVLQIMPTLDLYGQTTDAKRLYQMIMNMDAALTDVLNSKFYTSDQMRGTDEYDQKLLDEYTASNVDGPFLDYLRGIAPNKNEFDITEDAINAIKTQDYDVSRYVEELEATPDIVGNAKSSKQALNEQGRRHRLENRPYPGSNSSRVIADDNPLVKDYRDVSKDYNVPSPGILAGKIRDIDFYSGPWPGRRTNSYTLIT